MKTKLYLTLLSILPLFTFGQSELTNYGTGSGTGGNHSSYFGFQAGRISTGNGNTFLGRRTGHNNSSGSHNTYVGNISGYLNTTGEKNVFIGAISGQNNSTGSQNFFAGYAAGSFNETGYNNIYLGAYAGYTKKSGEANIFLGAYAGRYDSIGVGNIFIGGFSGAENKVGTKNIFVGNHTGRYNNDGVYNVFMGDHAGAENTNGSNNVFIGDHTGRKNTKGTNNTFIGKYSGFNNLEGNYNVYLGTSAGFNNLNGFNNVFIGSNAGYSETGSQKLYIENSNSATPLIYGEFDQDKVGINTTNLVGPYSLFVRDGIITEKVVVEVEGEWPDYVFNPTYQLPSLTEVSNFIQQHKHLPDIPSAKEIEEEGLNLGEMEALMMKKIEELTLYMIELQKENVDLKSRLEVLEKKLTKSIEK